MLFTYHVDAVPLCFLCVAVSGVLLDLVGWLLLLSFASIRKRDRYRERDSQRMIGIQRTEE